MFLGNRFTEESFQQLCFDFGIELDKDTENDPSRPKDQKPELAIEIPANRYDMLCFEGMTPPFLVGALGRRVWKRGKDMLRGTIQELRCT